MEIEKMTRLILVMSSILVGAAIVLLGLQVYQIINLDKKIVSLSGQCEEVLSDKQEDEGRDAVDNKQNQIMPSQNGMGGQQVPSGNQNMMNKKCGDGVCDDIEKANQNLCPADCNK